MILETTEAGISAIDVVSWAFGILGTMFALYWMYSHKITQARIKKLEDEVSLQKVKNQSFSDFQKYKNVSDSEFKNLVENLVEKLGDKIDGLSSEIHEMKIQIVEIIHKK